MIKIRQYEAKDYLLLLKFTEQLTDYIASVDYLKRQRRLSAYGKVYANCLLKKIKKNNGVIYFAEENGIPIGFVAGIMQKQTKKELLEVIPTKCGRILDLYLDPQNRSKGVGKKLMITIESYFKKKKCNIIKVEVFAPNIKAHNFYKHLGYENRSFDLIKVIE